MVTYVQNEAKRIQIRNLSSKWSDYQQVQMGDEEGVLMFGI